MFIIIATKTQTADDDGRRAMCRDERVYDNAEAFNPERFLSPDGGVTEHYPPVFGFGRR